MGTPGTSYPGPTIDRHACKVIDGARIAYTYRKLAIVNRARFLRELEASERNHEPYEPEDREDES